MAISDYKSKYLKKSGGLCPFCESIDISSGPIQADGPVARAEELTLGLYAKAQGRHEPGTGAKGVRADAGPGVGLDVLREGNGPC